MFKNKCSRCGFCCLAEQCPIGVLRYGQRAVCPGLSFDTTGQATCAIAGEVPIGDGCCISARAYKDGAEYDFATLSPTAKATIVHTYLSYRR